jgi:hypothetical protein
MPRSVPSGPHRPARRHLPLDRPHAIEAAASGWAPAWNRSQLERFLADVEAVLDARFGPSTIDLARGVVTFTTGAGETQLWLHRLADRCAALPPRHWRLAVYDHVAALDEVTGVYDDLLGGDLAPLRHRLGVRLHRYDTALTGVADVVTRRAFGDICAVLVVDLGGAAAWVPRAATAGWSVPPADLFDEAIDRSVERARCDIEVMERDGLVVVAASGPSFFTATLALRPAALAPVDEHLGAIVAAPSAHRVLVHPVTLTSRPALALLEALIGPERSGGVADALSGDLFWWRPGRGYRMLLPDPLGGGAPGLPADLAALLHPPP